MNSIFIIYLQWGNLWWFFIYFYLIFHLITHFDIWIATVISLYFLFYFHIFIFFSPIFLIPWCFTSLFLLFDFFVRYCNCFYCCLIGFRFNFFLSSDMKIQNLSFHKLLLIFFILFIICDGFYWSFWTNEQQCMIIWICSSFIFNIKMNLLFYMWLIANWSFCVQWQFNKSGKIFLILILLTGLYFIWWRWD